MADDIKNLEIKAQKLFEEKKYDEAINLFSQAGEAYQDLNLHDQSALCFASAAGCYESKAGKQLMFYYASTFYEKAAHQAEISGDFEYASTLYKHAGTCYERDLEFDSFSECFYLSKECYRKSLRPANILSGLWQRNPELVRHRTDFKNWLDRWFSWAALSLSSIIWGHGERPQRTILFGCSLILISAVIYSQGHLSIKGVPFKPGFFDSLYFSIVTMIRIGYGDIVPVGFSNVIAILEEFVGIFLVPLFLTGLCRKYLRF
jgi:tetratricopeptide (TPR) repeat protein